MTIESVELVIAALTAGATAGVTDTASTAVKDSYAALKSLVVKRLKPVEPEAEGTAGDAIARQLVDPKKYEGELRAALAVAEPAVDDDLMAAAKLVLMHVNPGGVYRTKYAVNADNAKGIVVGDHTTATFNFPR